MKTLDELLSERAQAEYQNALVEVLDPASWSAENRDTKLQEVRKLAEGVCDISEEFVKELLATNLEDGKSILWHKIREQFIMGEVELLMGFRDELDSMPEIGPDVPISYDWLNAQIKARYLEISTLNETINKITAQEGSVEEI
jgi:hypothetical protein